MMLSLVLATALAVSSLLLWGASEPLKAAAFLYPDLKTLKPTDLRLGTVAINGSTHKVLRFSNTVWNAGQGPLELRGKTIATNSGKKTRVYQRIYDNAGNFTSKYAGDFVYHPSHNHFHFVNFAEYQLWTRTDYELWRLGRKVAVRIDGKVVRTTPKPLRRTVKTLLPPMRKGHSQPRGSKITFCVMDYGKVKKLPGSPRSPIYSECDPRLQGLSVGWGDTYKYYLPDQWIDLGHQSLSDGEYVLRSVADPDNRIYESANKEKRNRESARANEGVTLFTVKNKSISDSAISR